MTDRDFFLESMQLVVERAKALAIRRTYIHSENGSQLDEAFDFKEAMQRVENLPSRTQEEWDTLKSNLLAMAEEGET